MVICIKSSILVFILLLSGCDRIETMKIEMEVYYRVFGKMFIRDAYIRIPSEYCSHVEYGDSITVLFDSDSDRLIFDTILVSSAQDIPSKKYYLRSTNLWMDDSTGEGHVGFRFKVSESEFVLTEQSSQHIKVVKVYFIEAEDRELIYDHLELHKEIAGKPKMYK